jgi:hypothetical protein
MNASIPWTTPADIREQLDRCWSQGRLLAPALDGSTLFPLPLRFKRPDANALSERFDEVRTWIRTLEEASRARQGFGYDIVWAETNHRQLGRNRVPAGVVVSTEADALRLIGKSRQAERFQTLAETTLKTFPSLCGWLTRKPLTALEHTKDWDQILAVLAWFRDHPRPALYLRQLEIPGVDTKFIEARKGLLSELLDQVLAADAVDAQAVGSKGFEQRYGLRSKPSLIRFRLLDESLLVQGLSDLTVLGAEFARLALPIRCVFITENEINGLAFPPTPGSLVIFGLGYGVDCLGEIGWLKDKALFYWGDIDTHGFAILDRLRAAIPHARSFLMDRETLMAHRDLWVREHERHERPLSRLDDSENALFDDLRYDVLGQRVRLEQERISFSRLKQVLGTLLAS